MACFRLLHDDDDDDMLWRSQAFRLSYFLNNQLISSNRHV